MCICVYICTCVHNHTCVKPACVCFAHNPKLLKCWRWLCSRNCIFFISQYSNVDFKHWNTDETQKPSQCSKAPIVFFYTFQRTIPAESIRLALLSLRIYLFQGSFPKNNTTHPSQPNQVKTKTNRENRERTILLVYNAARLQCCIHQNANET